MNTPFTQSIAQYAPLRIFARLLHDTRTSAQLIRELFPKALFHERYASRELLFEIAWSFLSPPVLKISRTYSGWQIGIDIFHRIGGLPAVITDNSITWYHNKIQHRDDKDPRTGLTLPAIIWSRNSTYNWITNGKRNRDDKDPRTGLTLPATIAGRAFIWWKNDRMMRDDRDPITGVVLPDYVDLDT